MSTLFPTSIDSPTNPVSSNTLNSPSHAGQHQFENDAIVALETKVGANSSVATTSFDYKLSGVTTGDKAVSKTGTETVTNKTLSTGTVVSLGSDATGDMYYRNASGVLTRLPAGSTGQIIQYNGSGVPVAVPNPAASNGSTTVAGIYQKATTADITAGTTTGTTGALLVIGADAVGAVGANKIVQLNGSSQLPAIDGSLLTNISASFKNGTSTPTIGSTTVFAHGLGRTPKFVHLSVIYSASFSIIHSHGSYTSSAQGCVYIAEKGSSGSLPISGLSSTYAVFIGPSGNGSSNSNNLGGTVSVDATNVTITWTTSGTPGTPTINLEWEVE